MDVFRRCLLALLGVTLFVVAPAQAMMMNSKLEQDPNKVAIDVVTKKVEVAKDWHQQFSDLNKEGVKNQVHPIDIAIIKQADETLKSNLALAPIVAKHCLVNHAVPKRFLGASLLAVGAGAVFYAASDSQLEGYKKYMVIAAGLGVVALGGAAFTGGI